MEYLEAVVDVWERCGKIEGSFFKVGLYAEIIDFIRKKSIIMANGISNPSIVYKYCDRS